VAGGQIRTSHLVRPYACNRAAIFLASRVAGAFKPFIFQLPAINALGRLAILQSPFAPGPN
jgi:hypothetical protein